MKYMVSCRQSLAFLKQATEIRVDYKDINRLQDFVTDEWVCQADIVLYIPKDQLIDWNSFSIYKDVLNIIIAVEDTDLINEAHKFGYKSFWSYPATTYWELRGLLDLGVDQVLLDAPLYFNLINVKNLCGDVEIRLVANKCINGYMKRKNGICGTYIRPEDIPVYEEYVSHIEFDTDDLQKERVLLKIYSEQKYWPGNLNFLLTYLGEDIDNRGLSAIPLEDGMEDEFYFAHRRIRCGQRCQENPSKCNFCPNVFKLINTIDKNKEWILSQVSENQDSLEN